MQSAFTCVTHTTCVNSCSLHARLRAGLHIGLHVEQQVGLHVGLHVGLYRGLHAPLYVCWSAGRCYIWYIFCDNSQYFYTHNSQSVVGPYTGCQ